jgi:cytoskeletal protein RodZ
MGRWKRMLVHVAWSGLVISGFPGVILPVAAQQAAVPAGDNSATVPKSPLVARAEEPPPLAELPDTELPDSPGTVAAKSGELVQQQSGTPQSQAQPSGQRPVGTAAAEAPDASGIAASQPAGIAMAPAKQRRTRTLILRMGAIIGAGVAVGSVVALTEATSSKPPGAH